MQKRRFLCTFLAALLLSAGLAAPGRAAQLIPMGQAVGIEAATDGLLITELTEAQTPEGPCAPARDAGLRPGDVIRMVDGKEVRTAEDLRSALAGAGERAVVRVDRGGLEKRCTVRFAFSEDGTPQMGVILRDGVTGIGTVTYCDPETNAYGALGHGVTDEKSGALLALREGEIVQADISGVREAADGAAGSLLGSFEAEDAYGSVAENTVFGIFGTLTETPEAAAVETAADDEIETGPAVIRSTVAGDTVREYDVTIDRIFHESGSTRFLLTVTDGDLIRSSGGIVQGMSGSPVLQGGRLVGAVTHVLLDDATRGYGVSIDTMLQAAA